MANLTIEIRDKRIPGGRLSISAGTDSVRERDARRDSLRQLLDLGDAGLRVLDLLRARTVTVEEVHRAVRSLNVGALVREAEARAQEKPAGPPPVMLGEVVDRFLLRVGSHNSDKTYQLYSEACQQMEAAFGVERDAAGRIVRDVEVATITAEAAESWLNGPKKHMAGHRWSPRTQRLKHSVALQVWALAMDTDEDRAEHGGIPRTITRNVWGKKRVRPPRARKTRAVFLQRPEAGRLLRTVRGRPQALWIALGLYAGLRAAEAAHLRTDVDVDLDTGWLHIQSRDGRHGWRTKTEGSARDVPITPELARWIRAHVRAGYAGERFLIRPLDADRPIEATTRIKWTRTAYEAAGIRYGRKGDALTYHSLRHTFASWLVQQDVQMKKVSLLLGDTTKIVDEVYSHLLPNDLRPVVTLLRKRKWTPPR